MSEFSVRAARMHTTQPEPLVPSYNTQAFWLNIYKDAQYAYKYKGESDVVKLSVSLAEKFWNWLNFPTVCSVLPAILVQGPFLISVYLSSKAEQVMKNIKRVCWCVRWQGYNYFHIALSVGSDIECRKPQLKLYEERERKREREGGIFLLFLEVMVVLGAPC